MALGAPISTGDVETVRLLLDAGADPKRYRDGDGRRAAVLPEALVAKAPTELIELLLSHGADADAPGPDGRSPYRLATALDREDVAGLLVRYGAHDDRTAVDRLLGACRQGDRETAMRLVAEHPGLPRAADHRGGRRDRDRRGGGRRRRRRADAGRRHPDRGAQRGDGATALHVAAHSGSVQTVGLLLARGADIEARDRVFDGNPLAWAAVGSGEQPSSAPDPDWAGGRAYPPRRRGFDRRDRPRGRGGQPAKSRGREPPARARRPQRARQDLNL